MEAVKGAAARAVVEREPRKWLGVLGGGSAYEEVARRRRWLGVGGGTSVCVCEVDAVRTFDPPRTEGGSADWLESKTPDSPFRLTLWIQVLWGD